MNDQPANTYLQQIQPRNFADLITHVYHDLGMAVGSIASYVELPEKLLASIKLDPDVELRMSRFSQQMRRHSTIMQNLVTEFAEMMKGEDVQSQSNSIPSYHNPIAIFCFELRTPMSSISAYTSIIDTYFMEKLVASSVLIGQRIAHLIASVQLTLDRMLTIINSYHDTVREARLREMESS